MMSSFRRLGLDPRAMKFAVPDHIETIDDAVNKIVEEAWKELTQDGVLAQVAQKGEIGESVERSI